MLKLSSKQISPKDRNPTCGDADDIGGEVFFVSGTTKSNSTRCQRFVL